ncbi:MAG: glycosyl transferase family 2 [Sphingobacteriaceae bacterium]|jgi:glycosyltransferase involved in cell wall biosynthesis|nr:glycosyl transferase family 2 [Sphingobacteriaceae bacterium]
MHQSYRFDDVTLLVTHYNRSNSLQRLLDSFENEGVTFGEIIVSDDCSAPQHFRALEELQGKYKFRLITARSNKGLGNNINKGQEAVKLPYTLYVQEDFVAKPGAGKHLKDALTYLQEDGELDMVRFYAYFKYPFLQPFKSGFSRMIFSPYPWYFGYRKFYYYSDHPHLRRSTFFSKFGKYAEGLKSDVTEYKMMLSVIQKKGKALFYDNFQDIFEQVNSSSEPSTVKRSSLRQSNSMLIMPVKHVFRYVKFHFNYNFRSY